MSRPSSITLEDCQSLFYLPVAQAAVVLGVSRPTISKVLRAHGIKRWPYRKLRAEGKIEALRQRRETVLPHVLPVLPPLPPPLPPLSLIPKDDGSTQIVPIANCQNDHSAKSEPLCPRPQESIPDDETYILHLLDRPISPTPQVEDHTHPFLSLAPAPEWTCNEQLDEQDIERDQSKLLQLVQSPLPPPPPVVHHDVDEFHTDVKSHTISTVRAATRAVVGSGSWSRGVFQQDGDRVSFAFLPAIPFGSSLSEEDPLNANVGSEF